MKHLCSLLLCLFLTCTAQAQQPWTWATGGVGSPGNSNGTALTTDADGNVYVAGHFDGFLTLGNSTNSAMLTDNSNGYFAFIAKYNPQGALLWAYPLTCLNGDAQIGGLAVGSQGQIYATGFFSTRTSTGTSTLSYGATTLTNTKGFVL